MAADLNPTTDELERWAALVSAARGQARHPDGHATTLGRAAKRVRSCRIPPGYVTRESCFYRLMVLAQTFASYRADQRPAKAAELKALADAVGEVLDHADRPSGWSARRDIAGDEG